MLKYFYILIIALFVFSCAEPKEKKVYTVAEVPPPPVAVDLYTAEVDSVYNSLTQRERIQQLFWLNIQLEEPLKKEVQLPAVSFVSAGSEFFS